MKRIVVATKNSKKAAEIQRMVPGNVEILCLSDIPETSKIPQAEENGKTFIENAEIKARYWHRKLNLPVLAEDSGLEIEALNGYPGVNTKRCIQELCPGADINEDKPGELYPLLLELMNKSGNPSKTARWFSAMAYVDDKTTIKVENFLTGKMTNRAGEKEFGFDQYLKPIGSNLTLSQMSPEEKDEVGPRKKTLEKILEEII